MALRASGRLTVMIMTRSRTSVLTSSDINPPQKIVEILSGHQNRTMPNPLSYDQFTSPLNGHTRSCAQNQLKSTDLKKISLILVRTHANFSAHYFNASAILGSAWLCPAAALRHGGRCRHLAYRDVSAGNRARTLERRLRPAIATPDRRPLW